MRDIQRDLPFIYWSDKTKLDWLQRYLIIHSILYYQLDSPIISDKEYDSMTNQYLKLVENTPTKVFKKTQYYYCFEEFDGSTGFDLYDKLTEEDKEYLMCISNSVLYSKTGGN